MPNLREMEAACCKVAGIEPDGFECIAGPGNCPCGDAAPDCDLDDCAYLRPTCSGGERFSDRLKAWLEKAPYPAIREFFEAAGLKYNGWPSYTTWFNALAKVLFMEHEAFIKAFYKAFCEGKDE